MAAQALRRTYDARNVTITVSQGGASLLFTTRADEDVVIAIDRQLLASLQRQIARGLTPAGDSAAQP